MSAATTIEWTDRTWNPTRGCSLVSHGCTNCYAMKQAHRFSGQGKPYEGLTRLGHSGPTWTGKVRLVPEALDQPRSWRNPSRVFVNSMSDLFHEGLHDSEIAAVFTAMGLAERHTFQVLTKRPKRMLDWFNAPLVRGAEIVRKASSAAEWPLPNVWLGVSVEDQATADERIPLLLQTPAAVRFVSYEPALGPVDFAPWVWPQCISSQDEHDREHDHGFFCVERALDWLIVGGESGPKARPCNVEWARSARNQCVDAGVAFFYKQGGSSNACIHDRKGGHFDCFPEDLKTREFPYAS
jgi:protein gp37